MLDMIKSRRRSEDKEGHDDLFNNLIDAANDESEGAPKLTESELIGMYQRL